jgi:hypothetical protein
VQAWNFNQHEAHAAFSLAAAEDPACARCWWGVTYALGPGANRCPNHAGTLVTGASTCPAQPNAQAVIV